MKNIGMILALVTTACVVGDPAPIAQVGTAWQSCATTEGLSGWYVPQDAKREDKLGACTPACDQVASCTDWMYAWPHDPQMERDPVCACLEAE